MEFAVILFLERQKFSVVHCDLVDSLPGGSVAINQDVYAKESATNLAETAKLVWLGMSQLIF